MTARVSKARLAAEFSVEEAKKLLPNRYIRDPRTAVYK